MLEVCLEAPFMMCLTVSVTCPSTVDVMKTIL